MRIAFRPKLLPLISLLPFLIAACSDSPEEASEAAQGALASDEGILQYVPADTPYVFAAAEPIPDDVRDKFAPHLEKLMPAYRSLLQAALQERAAEPAAVPTDEPTDELTDEPAGDAEESMDEEAPEPAHEPLSDEERQHMSAMLDQLAGMITPDGIPEAGIDRDSTAVIYGIGLLPVLRVTLSDGALFEKAFAKMESGAGGKMEVAEIDGHAYRFADDDQGKGRVIVAVIDDQLVVSLVPTALPEDLFKSVLGLTLPEDSIAESGALSALAQKYDYQAYALGFIDFAQIADTFLGDPSGVNEALLSMMDYDAASLTDVCKAEIRSVAGIVPRFVTGYTDVTTGHFKSNSVFEIRSDLATGLQTLTAPVPGLGQSHGGLVSFGMSLNLQAAREFYSARLDAMEAKPYQCELFADLQQSVAQGREILNQPVPPVVYGFRGFLAVIDDIQGMDLQNNQPPTDIDMRFLVATDDAKGLLAMGAMFSPEIASLNLQPDAKPVKLTVPAIASAIDAAYVAMSESALALSFGAGSEAGLEGMLAAGSATPAPFVSMDMDAARYYGFIGDATMINAGEAPSPEMTKALGDVMNTLEAMFKRISFDVRFTDRGIEIPSTVELAD